MASLLPSSLLDPLRAAWASLSIQPGFWSVAASAGAISFAYAAATAFKSSAPISISKIRADGGQALTLRDGRLLEYFIHGNPNAKTVIVAIHGATTTGKLFAFLDQWAMSSNVKIIAPTLPGFGLTPYTAYTLEGWVRDLQELLSEVKVDRFHIVGTSLGSIHAAAAASLYQPKEAVGNVELYVAFAPADDKHDPLQGSVLSLFGKLRRFPLVKRLLEKLFFLPLLRSLTPADSDVRRSIRHQWEGTFACADIIYLPWNFDWHSIAKGRRVVIVSGKSDEAAPPHNQHWLHALIPGSELVEYEGAHDRPLREPALLIGHLQLLLPPSPS